MTNGGIRICQSNSQCYFDFHINFQVVTGMDKIRRCNYKRITEEVRMEIIDRILERGENIKDVAQQIHVNISTCKAILKVYQQEGRVGKKKRRNKVFNVIETFSFYTVDGSQVQQIGDIKIDETKVSLERNEDFDKFLEDNARQKAQSMLENILEERKQSEQAASQFQNQLMQYYLMQNGYLQFMNPPMPIVPDSPVKQEEMASIYLSIEGSNRSGSSFSGEVKQE